MGSLNVEVKTKQYTVYITDKNNTVNGSGVLFYAGGDSIFVFTCAHVVDNLDIIRLFLLQPIDIDEDLYQVFVSEVTNEQVYYSPLKGRKNQDSAKIHSDDFAIIQIQKPKSFNVEPANYNIGDTSRDSPIYVQGYPNGVPIDAMPVEYLECLHGAVFVNIANRNRFTIRITENYLDAGNRIYELQGISGSAVWDAQDSLEKGKHSLLGLISCADGPSALLSRFFVIKLQQLRELMKEKFGIIIERRIVGLSEENISESDYVPVIFDGTVAKKTQISEREKWINEQISVCRCYIADLQLQKTIDTAKEAISNWQFSSCCQDAQKCLMELLLYCYEIGYLDEEFDLLEEEMRNRGILKKYDILSHMTRTFMRREYKETIRVAEECIEGEQANKSLLSYANAFLLLAKAYENDLPIEETIHRLLNEHGNYIFDNGNEDDTALIYQLIGYVYGERYHDYVKAVRFLYRSYRIGFDNTVLESLGAAYYFLGIADAIGEDGLVDWRKVDKKALYKARECFLIIIRKADALFWAGTMRRVGLCVYNTFVFLNDNYRIITLYPDIKRYVVFREEEQADKLWRDIEMKYAKIIAQSGNIDTSDYPHIILSDQILLETIAMTNRCINRIETMAAELQSEQIDYAELEEMIKATIKETEKNIHIIDLKDRLLIYIQLMNMYGQGMLLFGWKALDQLKDYLTQIQKYDDPDLLESMENFVYEMEAPIDDTIQKYQNTFDKKNDLTSWLELNHLYIRHRMMDKADAMYKELFAERKELVATEPEFAYRAYINYISLYHRDLKDAIQCYLDAKEMFRDTDIEDFWELELMVKTNTFNNPERFEIERIHFMERGLITEEQFHRTALIAYMANLNEKKAREHAEYIRNYPRQINPETHMPIIPREEIHFLNWIGVIKPRFAAPPGSMKKERISLLLQLYGFESWHVKINKQLRNHFNIEKKIAIDAWSLYILAETTGLDILEKFDKIYVSHLTIIRLLEELSVTNNTRIRMILDFIGSKKVVRIQSAEFKIQMIIRAVANYVEPASAVAIGTEQECLIVLGEPELESRLVDKFKHAIIRVNEMKALLE